MDKDWYDRYSTFDTRFGCHCGLSCVMFMPLRFGIPLFIAALIFGILALYIEKPTQRKTVFLIWLTGIATSIAIVLVISNWLIQLVLYLICLMVAAGLLYEMSGKETSETKPKPK